MTSASCHSCRPSNSRDTRIEAIGWAVKADLESDAPSDPLYIDLLAHALAVRVIETATGHSLQPRSADKPRLSPRQLRRLTEFIDSHLDQKLHLAELATVAGVSVTRLKTLFRNSTGTPVHQYVIRRRVEYARALLSTTAMAASAVATAAGFSIKVIWQRRCVGYWVMRPAKSLDAPANSG